MYPALRAPADCQPSQAVLKIVKHCKEHLPQLVTGQLLGLDFGCTLEVTNCFPFPSSTEGAEDAELAEDGAEYQYDMMRCLRCVLPASASR